MQKGDIVYYQNRKAVILNITTKRHKNEPIECAKIRFKDNNEIAFEIPISELTLKSV